MRHRTRATPVRALAAAAALVLATPFAGAQVCPDTLDPPASWSGGLLDTDTEKDGIVYSTDGTARLELADAGGSFQTTSLGISDYTVYAAPADFDRDGWTDFVGTGEGDGFMRIYRNLTALSPEPADWDDDTLTRAPRFEASTELSPSVINNRRRPVAAGDFNGDGWPDVFRASAAAGSAPTVARLWLNLGANDVAGNPTFGGQYDAMAAGTTPSMMGAQTWSGTMLQAVDYNGDRKLDLLVGSGENNGEIRVFLNDCTLVMPIVPPADPEAMLPCAAAPHFTFSSVLITDMGFPASANLPVFAYEDVDGDGLRDLVASAPSCCAVPENRLRLWLGVSGGGLSTTPQSITFQGGATVVFVADFSGDGKKDLIVGTDNWNYNPNRGADSFYWKNDGTATPFAAAPIQLTSYNHPTIFDFDVGFVFDYDHDPQGTLDLMIADGNDTSNFYVQANRVVDRFVECGEVASGTIDLGTLEDSEMVVTAARLEPLADPAANTPGDTSRGTIRYFLSNEEPPNWVEATVCPDDPAFRCASFPRPVGRRVRWKAEMCSTDNRRYTPQLYGIEATFDYTRAREHFRAGAVVSDGVVYLGGFRQPGDRGRLFAVAAGFSETYWDAAEALDDMADSARHIFTANRDGDTRIPFTTANAGDAELRSTLGASDATQASAVIAWVRSARFGVGNDGIDKTRLGAIETSTPAVLNPPGLPIWYTFATPAARAEHASFRTAQANRPKLVLVGAKDGMVHAIRSEPTSITTAPSGLEAWAFIPPKIAAGMIEDYTDSLTAGATQIASYPDGSPTLADFVRADGSYGTVALIGSGNGGKSFAAIDVTSTIDGSGNVIGPTPMWSAVPGDAEAGQAMAKASVARVLVDGRERYVALTATGIAHDNPVQPFTKGRVVSAYDLTTGELLWKFQAMCAVTSDLTVFETDDEPGTTLNGYIDRVVFADACGYVYKVDPGRDLDGGWNGNRGLGTRPVESAGLPPDEVEQFAVFSTKGTAGALGVDSPITGTLAARADENTSRVVLFFGTGGLESHAVTEPNEFYAVFADTGEIRNKVAGTCSAGRCEKFYGGTVLTSEQVIFTHTMDPAIGMPGCQTGSTKVSLLDLTTLVGDPDLEIGSAVMGAIYGDADSVYLASLSGEIHRVGTPRAAHAGGDTANPPPTTGSGNENVPVGTIGTTTPMTMLGWRQVY